MPNNYTDTNVSDLIFNVLDSATYEDLSTNSQLNNNQLYLITDDESSGIEYIVGSQTAATNAWLGTTKEKNLYTGKVIAYKLPYAGTNSAASLTLTLADNSQTPAIPVKLNNTNVTTHYAAGAVILMVYDGAAWRSTDYWNSNSRDPGYGKITPGAASAAVTGITANTTQVTAKTYNEAITVNPGNKWVQLAGSESATAGSDTFTIAHAVQSNVSGNYGDSTAQTPSFGETFKVPYISVDEAGHISSISDHNVTIPTKPASASAADAFSSGTTVALTGVVTGTSSSSTKGWSVPTTITDGAVTNSMLANSSIGIAGNNVSLGGSITAATLRSSLGLNQAMQFIGKAVNTVRDGYSDDPGIGGYDISEAKAGDVIIDKDNSYEYIWTTAGKWERLGPDGNYKITQSAVSSPSASGSATAFIDTISQDANGVITVTKKNLNTSGTWSGTAARATVADSADSIEWDNVINKPSSFTPASHSHGNITNGGDITATAPTVANGDQIIINDNSASKITNGPTFDGSTTTKALTPKGTWETFLNSHQSVTNAEATLSWGEATNIATIGSTNINVTLPSNPNTDIKVSTAAVTSGTTYYPVVGANTTSAATKFYDASGLVYAGTNGTTSVVGSAKLTLGNSTASGIANNKQGQLILYGSTAYATTITPGAPTAARTITLPNKTGTVALTSDIPAAYSLTAATDSALGGIKIGYSSSGKNYAVQLNNDNQAYVNVPWTDNNDNTTYVFNTTAQTNKIQYKETGASSWTDVPITVSISNNITGSGTRTNGYLAQFSGTNTITNGPQIGSSTTTFLRNDGTWATPPVTSVAGKSGAVSLGTLTIGDKTYNGTGNITISLEDLNIASTTTMLGITDTALSDGNTTNPINLVIPASGSTTAVDSNIVMRQDTGEEFVWLSGAWHKMGVASSYALEHHIHGNITNAGAITSDTTITTGHHLVITDGNNKVSRASITFDTSKTGKALSQAGTWIDVNNYSLPTASASVLGGIKVGSGLSISSGVLSHTDTSSQSSVSASGRRYITGVTLDTYGHVTGLTTGTETVTNTDTLVKQTAKSDNVNYKILMTTSASPTSGNAAEAAYDTDITINPSTNTITATNFAGNASTATAFSSGTTVALTGDTTGTSASSTKGWSISTTTKKLSQTTTTDLSSFTDSTAFIYTAAGGSNTITDKPTLVDAFGCLSFKTADGWYGQILMSSNTATGLYWRTATSLSEGWKKLLDSTNYTDYTVKKDGTGASGTWGISISGNAATATKLASAQKVYVTLGTASTTTTIQGGSSSAETIGVNGTLGVGNGGTGNTSYTANRIIYSESATKLSASGHYANSEKIAINSNAAPTQNLYVNGTSYFNGNVTHNGTTYFANGTTYYIDNSATGNLNNIVLASTTDVSAGNSANRTGSLVVAGGIHADKGLKVGKWTNTSTAPGVGIKVHDLRDITYTGSIFGDSAVNWYFDQVNGDWVSSMSIKGWTGSYYSWEIAGNATNSSVDKYYVRTSPATGTAGTWHTLVYLPAFAAIGSSTQPIYVDANGKVTAITGNIANGTTGNAATATKLATARTINGTSFDGSGNITTANWGTARNISISDSDGTNTGTAVSVNGSAAATLKLPSTIKATLSGNASTATAFSSNATVTLTGDATGTSAGSTKSWSVPVTLANSGVTAGSYGPSANASPAHSGTFSVPYITVDAKGRVTSASTITITLPASGNTDAKVTQTATTTSANYEVLFSATADNTTRTEGARKNSNLTFNPSTGTLTATKVYGAVWNDYAEFRQSDQTEPGRVVIEKGDDTLILSTERLQPGAEIISDTYGFAIGETNNCKTPIAASGRVLAYPFEDRELFKAYVGAPVCSGPNGTVSIMTEEEEMKYPSRIIGTISAVPDYEEWGTGKVKVNGRVWIRIR